MSSFTKLYLTNRAAPYTPATLRGAWDQTAGAITAALDSTKEGGGSFTSVVIAEVNASNTWDVHLYRGISGPLAAQTLSGNLNVMIGVDTSNADTDAFWHIHVYVTQGDSDTPRGTLINDYVENTTNEWPATDSVIQLQSAQAISLAISAGDRIVVELGCICRNSTASSRSLEIHYGTISTGNDRASLPDATAGTNPTNTEQAPYIEFSVAVDEPVLDTRVSQAGLEVFTNIGTAPIRASQVGLEIFSAVGSVPLRASQVGLEVFTLTPVADDPVITTATLPDGDVAEVYSEFVEVEDGDPPYTWSISSGTLPPGLSLNTSTGEISGTPTTEGVYVFTVEVSDTDLDTDSVEYTVIIGDPPPIITTTELDPAIIDVAYSETVVATAGDTPFTWTIEAGSLPSGLSLNATTGEISGTPDTYGIYTFTIRVTDDEGDWDEAELFIEVTDFVITDPATDVLETTATIHGRVHPNGVPTWGYFRYDSVFPPFNNTTTPESLGSGNDHVPIEFDLTGLEPGTIYFFQAWSQILESGELVDHLAGAILSFTTSGELTPSPAAVTQTVMETATAPGISDVRHLAVDAAQEPDQLVATQVGFEEGQAPDQVFVTQMGVEIATTNVLFDPVEGEDLCETQDDPVTFASWRPTVSGERMWFAETPLDDPLSYYGGWKPDKLMHVSEVRRSLSSTAWELEASSFTIQFADDDYAIRNVLSEAPGKFWYKREIEAFFVTPLMRRLGGVAKKIATGFVDSDPSFDDLDEGMSVSFTCRDRLSIAMGWTQQGQAQLPRRRINEYTLPDAHLITRSAWHKGGQLIYGTSPTVSGYPSYFGAVSAMPLRENVVLPDMQGWHEFLLNAMALKEVLSWHYLKPSGEAADGSFVYETVEDNLGSGTEWLVPNTPEWNAMFSTTDNFRDLVGGDGVTRRWTPIYGRGPKADLAMKGEAYIAARVRGIERIGDSTGDVLDDLHDQFAHFLENVAFVEGDGPDLLWNVEPTFGAEDMTILDYFSFADLKAQRTNELGTEMRTFGVVGHFGALDDVSEHMTRWQSSGDFRVGTNRFWQQGIWAIDRSITPADTTPILDTYEVHVRTFKPSPRIHELANWTHYRYRKDWVIPDRWHIDFEDADPENGRDTAQTVNETSMSNWGNEKREAEVSFYFQVYAQMMEHVLGEIANRWSQTPTYVELEGSLCLMNKEFDVGRPVTLDHWRGIGPAGYVGRPFWVLANTLVHENRRVRLELLDLKDIIDDDFSSYANPEDDHLVGPN